MIFHPCREVLEQKSKDFWMLLLVILPDYIFHPFVRLCSQLLRQTARSSHFCFFQWFLLLSASFPYFSRGCYFNDGRKKNEEIKSGKPIFLGHRPIFCACWRFWRRCSMGENILFLVNGKKKSLRFQGESPSIFGRRGGGNRNGLQWGCSNQEYFTFHCIWSFPFLWLSSESSW